MSFIIVAFTAIVCEFSKDSSLYARFYPWGAVIEGSMVRASVKQRIKAWEQDHVSKTCFITCTAA